MASKEARLSLADLQKQHAEWSAHNFGEQPAWVSILGVMEELGELSHSFIKQRQGIRMGEDHHAGIQDAVGDIVIFLASFCTAYGIDMQREVERSWSTTKARDWKRTR